MKNSNKNGLRLDFIAADKGDNKSSKVRVSGEAYGGGKMAIGWWDHPVVIDLDGMAIPGNVPLLADHINGTDYRVGLVVPTVVNNALLIDGEIVSNSDVATEISEQLKAGAEWQLSVGANVQKYELVEDGERQVNGQMHAAPFFHITQSTLREVSVVAIGADSSTRMRVAATFKLSNPNGGNQMQDKTEKKPVEATTPAEVNQTAATPQPVVAAAQESKAAILASERARIADIKAMCAGEFPDIEAEAIQNGSSVDETSMKVLAAMRANRPQADKSGISIHSAHDIDARTIEASLCFRAGIDESEMLKAYGEQVMEAGSRNRGMSLQQLFAECARLEGKSVPRTFSNDTIRAGFSTVSLPGILGNVANKRLLKSFQAQPVVALTLCSAGDLNDFKEAERYRLTDVGDLQPVAPGGELKSGKLTENKATNQLATYGKLLTLDRTMIYNDDLGAFLAIPAAMGARAARKIDQVFFTRLLANGAMEDGVAIFHATHKNYASGATTALAAASMKVALKKFLDQVDSDSQPIAISPKYLVVPTDLKFTALELLKSSTTMSVGATDKDGIMTYNSLMDENLQAIASPYLSNVSITGYSTTAWYLWGDPNVVDTFEIGYLRGQRTPTIERGETDFNTLGIRFRVYFDFGVREQDHRGMVKMAGA